MGLQRVDITERLSLSIGKGKQFHKIQHSFTIKTLSFTIKTVNKLGREGMYLNIIKGIYDTSTANMILNDEKL